MCLQLEEEIPSEEERQGAQAQVGLTRGHQHQELDYQRL